MKTSFISLRDKWMYFVVASCTPHERLLRQFWRYVLTVPRVRRPVILYCKIWRLGLSNSCLQGLATYYSFKEIL